MSTTFFRGENPLKADKLNSAFAERVSRAGDTMQGMLRLAADPVAAFDAATKQYVDRFTAMGVPTGAYIGASPPGNVLGPLWWDTNSGQLFIQYNDGSSTQWVSANSIDAAQLEGSFLPLTGGTIGSTPYGATTFAFNPVNPRNGSAHLMLNKVQGSVLGDDPQISSYWALDYNGGMNPYHVQIVTSATGNTGVWSFMNQSYFTANDSIATNGHVGFYSQQVRTGVNAGGTRGTNGWSGIFELRSQTGLPSAQDGILQTLELDLMANGADDYPGIGRTIISCVIGSGLGVGAGVPVEVSNGISFFLMAGDTGHYKQHLLAASPFSVAVLNTTVATQMSGANAIWLRDGHTIAWDTAGTHYTRWDGSNVRFTAPVQIDGNIYTPSGLTVGGVTSLAGGGSTITAAPGDNSTKIATTAFVTAADTAAGATYLPKASGTASNLTLNGAGGWSAHNIGKQLFVTGGGNPGIGISDASGTNIYAVVNNFGQMLFASMPALADSGTAPVYMLSLSPTGNVTGGTISWKFGGPVGFNNTAPIAKPTGVAVTAAAIHAALVSYGLIAP